MFFALSTLSSKGLFASSDAGSSATAAISASVKCSGDDVHLLFARQPHEIHGIAGHPDRETRIYLRMIHRIHQRLAIEHVDVHVIAGRAEERVEHRGEVGHALVAQPAKSDGDDGGCARDSIR